MIKKIVTGYGGLVESNDLVKMYRDIVNWASPTSGHINKLSDFNYGLTCNFSTTDCDTLEKAKTCKQYHLVLSKSKDRHIEFVQNISQPQQMGEIATRTSNNKRWLARLRSDKSAGGKKQLLEIWDRSRLLKTFDIDELKEHGAICVDEVFSSMTWSSFGEQDKLLYVCRPKKKVSSFFGKNSNKDNQGQPEEYLKEDDWGERLNGITHTMVAFIDIGAGLTIKTLDLDKYSVADSRWLHGDRIVSTAYAEHPRYGLVLCNNRASKLVIQDLSGSVLNEISVDGHSVSGPRVSHDGKKLVYLTSLVNGPHWHSQSMHLYDIESRKSEQLSKELFIGNWPMNCFTSDDRSVLFTNSSYIQCHLSLIDLHSKELYKIKFPTSNVNILDFEHDIILASGSEVNTTNGVYVASLTTPDLVAWHQIEDCFHFDEVNYQVHKIQTPDDLSFVSALLICPNLKVLFRNLELKDTGTSEAELPTVVMAHGGPHSNFICSYMPTIVLYARLGFKILLINYRGSTGVDENYVRSLSGRAGTQDIEDCLHVIRFFVKNKSIDPTKLVIQGGSHGGFIACHLSCQDEFKFTSAIIRNPVVNIVSLLSTTDIPDWCYSVVLNQDIDLAKPLTIDELNQFYLSSPASKAAKAYVPTLMLLGSEDKRVPMKQGEYWVNLLKARGVETKCKVYADEHALQKPDAAADSAITAIIWMLEHLSGATSQSSEGEEVGAT